MKKVLKIVFYIVLVAVLLFAAFIITAMVKDYQPEDVIVLEEANTPDKIADSVEFSVLSWNIGYCGLSEDMDFFYDGGKRVRSSKENVIKNLTGITNFLKSTDSVDFILLQEVDKKSKRSYQINEADSLKEKLKNHKTYYGKNYDVFHVPSPITEPYGNVMSGLFSFSKLQPNKVTRYSFPSSYGFPMKYFMLDRCFLVTRLNVSNGKDLLIINTHNSAYDDGSMRLQEMTFLKDFLLSEYNKGNYVIVGGDWNQCPPNVKQEIPNYVFDNEDFLQIKEDYMPNDWKWIFSNNLPTNRRVYEVWNQQKTKTTIIDYFLISPNVENLQINTINLNFKYSDHQPVIGRFKLK